MADNDILQGFQAGLQASQQRLSNSARMQELKSQEAVRRQQERESVARMQVLLEKHQMEVQQQADVTKAFGLYSMLTSPTIPGRNGLPMPNPMRVPEGTAAIQAFLPLAKTPAQAIDIASKGALMNERQESGEALTAQREASARLSEARIKQVDARTEEIIKGRPGAQPEWVESITFLEERLGHKLEPEVIQRIYDIKSGLKPRAGTQRVPSEGEFVSRHIEKVMEQPIIKEENEVDRFFGGKQKTVRFRRPKTLEEGEAVLKQQYQRLFSPTPEAATAAPVGGSPAPVQPEMQPAVLPTTRIPVISPSGQRGFIPASQLEQALKEGYKQVE